MFAFQTSSALRAKLAALDRVQAVIEFDLSGRILTANETFLRTLGYALPEIVGQHHRMFVDPAERDGPAYAAFWERLRAGQFEAAQYRRLAKGGREVWIEASYNPVLDRLGRPVRVVKFATDITARKAEEADRAGQVAAIRRTQGVIAFDLDGTILEANDVFLGLVGYHSDEVAGRHHSLFVEADYAASADYAAFWDALRQGRHQTGQYRRLGKGGRPVWIQAAYTPILDAAGRPTKVVKFATDVGDQVRLLADLRTLIDRNFQEIDGAVASTAAESASAGAAARTTATNVQTMAAASEELAVSVAEISASMAQSRAATDNATDRVQEADARTRRLAEAAGGMTGIAGLISAVAAQINLLALNATIEAARAGEAGRGFAVVAQEVKTLARQAADATGQINAEIGGIQAISAEVVAALDSIRGSVATLSDHVVATAAAVEEQSAVTRSMSENMQEAAHAVSAISENIVAISGAVGQVSGAVAGTRRAAQVLAR
ncbi:PAS domain-containing methyl-accepting chemotaxis protein [uncultured Methylobacterium sp.]|jgi:methyl-accepting chemotaxis protein|uniref:methyl-accepting chemotaxis protein n=1 Tax=uncultured Methylobacterium sp. TaxID=157278 RepID=UPI00260FFC01|nr:PAS domain-containing methyl-accepting chemotaxis protein [uncultured Methylobacterium sp.]